MSSTLSEATGPQESAARSLPRPGGKRWLPVCRADRVSSDRGVALLVHDHPVALFGLQSSVAGGEKQWFAVDHLDPVSGAPVIARGLVGSCGDVSTVSSPLHKQKYCLRTGSCIDSPDLKLRTHPVRIVGDWVEIQHVQPLETRSTH